MTIFKDLKDNLSQGIGSIWFGFNKRKADFSRISGLPPGFAYNTPPSLGVTYANSIVPPVNAIISSPSTSLKETHDNLQVQLLIRNYQVIFFLPFLRGFFIIFS